MRGLNSSRAWRGAATAPVSEQVARGDAARDERDWGEAERSYRQALAIDEAMPHIWIQLGHACKEQGKFEEAEEAYRKGAELDPTSSDAALQLGHLLKILGRKTEAEDGYAKAYSLDPLGGDARNELIALGWSRTRLDRMRGRQKSTKIESGQVILELTDVLDFLQRAKFPTGIQRVQLALAEAATEFTGERRVVLAAFDAKNDRWVPIDLQQVRAIVDLVDEAAFLSDEARATRAARIRESILRADDFAFEADSFLVNPGTSWGFPNYFLCLRDARRRFGLHYIPFVHDCIPLIFPEYCSPDLISDFITWITGMLVHTDLVLVNSENTKADLARIADGLDLPFPKCVTVMLNAQFQRLDSDGADSVNAVARLREHNLDMRDFVLFVSTIEPRKNHALVLSTWSKMIKAGRNTPVLVCAGAAGWYNEDFHQLLDRNIDLSEKVLVLTDISDQLLRLLYERCLFTVYPSRYEGWGLPISESFGYGKVPLVSRVASLPEAGGDLAEYFDLESEVDFRVKLERLIDDEPYRKERERKIAEAPNLRTWADVAKQVIGAVVSPERLAMTSPPIATIRPGVYYSFARKLVKRISDAHYSAEMFRDTLAWDTPESFGCWIRSPADLVFNLEEVAGIECILYLHLYGVHFDNIISVSIANGDRSKKFNVDADSEMWERVPLRVFEETAGREIRLRLTADKLCDFAVRSEGKDVRQAAVGLKGIYLCRSDDIEARLKILEAIATGDLDGISRRSFNREPM
jgi:glycosyltransferase involved in cell wall biosynthesis